MAGAVPVAAMTAAVVDIVAAARIIEAVVPAIAGPAAIPVAISTVDVAVIAAAAIGSIAVIAVVDTSAERQRAGQRQQRKRPAKPPPAYAVACHSLSPSRRGAHEKPLYLMGLNRR
jgi:hypothetical protein